MEPTKFRFFKIDHEGWVFNKNVRTSLSELGYNNVVYTNKTSTPSTIYSKLQNTEIISKYPVIKCLDESNFKEKTSYQYYAINICDFKNFELNLVANKHLENVFIDNIEFLDKHAIQFFTIYNSNFGFFKNSSNKFVVKKIPSCAEFVEKSIENKIKIKHIKELKFLYDLKDINECFKKNVTIISQLENNHIYDITFENSIINNN